MKYSVALAERTSRELIAQTEKECHAKLDAEITTVRQQESALRQA